MFMPQLNSTYIASKGMDIMSGLSSSTSGALRLGMYALSTTIAPVDNCVRIDNILTG